MSENKFKTKVDVEISYDSEKPKGFDYESRSSKANLNYVISMDIREWGIKDISPHAPSQDIELEIELLDEKTEEVETYIFKVKN